MPIPSTNISSGLLAAEYQVNQSTQRAFKYFWDNVNIWAANKFYNRTLNGYQKAGTTHGLYRDANKAIGYNKGAEADVKMSDLINYNHTAYSPSYFEVTAIYDMLGHNVLQPDGSFTLLYNFRYTVEGLLYRGEIDPYDISDYTRWVKPNTNSTYGGLAFNKAPDTNIASGDVVSNTEYDPGQQVSFQIMHNSTPTDFFNIWYCYRDSSGQYKTTGYKIENDYWNQVGNIIYSPITSINEYPDTYLVASTRYGKYQIEILNTDFNFNDYLQIRGWIFANGIDMYPSSVTVEQLDGVGGNVVYTLSCTYNNSTGNWETGQQIEEDTYYRVTWFFGNDTLTNNPTEIDELELAVGLINNIGGHFRYFYEGGEYFEW